MTATVEERESIPATNPVVKKVSKILESGIDLDNDAIEAIHAVSEVIPQNTISARRNLRSSLEKRSLSLTLEFLEEAKKIQTPLDHLAETVKQISRNCAEMRERLSKTKSETSSLIERTKELQDENNKLNLQHKLYKAFAQRFTLSDRSNDLLHSKDPLRTEEISELLEIVAQIDQIGSNAKILLRTKEQKAGLDVMEIMAASEEAAFEKIFRWTQKECRAMTHDVPDISLKLTSAIGILSRRKFLLKYVLEEYTGARRIVFTRSFIDVLTKPGKDSSTKPIELHSHDPVRYVGDMLAWIHQNLASEKEYHDILLKDVEIEDEILRNSLASTAQGLCRPLKVRFDQVVANEPDAIALFKVRSLLKYYHTTMSQRIGDANQFSACLEDAAVLFNKLFFTTLQTSLSLYSERRENVCRNLLPTPSVMKTLQLLEHILRSFDVSINYWSDSKTENVREVVDLVVTSLVQSIQLIAAPMNLMDMAVFLVNSLHRIKTTLALYQSTDDKIEQLSGQIEAQLDTIVNEQVSYIFVQTDLLFLQQKGTGTLTTSELERLHLASNALNSFLVKSDAVVLPQVKLISSTALREAVVSRSFTSFIAFYEDLVNHSTAVAQILRPPEHLKQILL